jgi:TolA-binding protein
MLLQARFNQVDIQIANVQSEIAKLQQQLSDLQTYRQNLQSVEQACESALSQIDVALLMLNNVDATEIATFKAAVDAKFGTEAIASLPAVPEVETEVEPVQPDAPQTPAIDVDVVSEVDPGQTDTPQSPAIDVDVVPETASSNGHKNGSADTTFTASELLGFTYKELQKLAKAKGVNCKGMKQGAIATALDGKVTQADLADLN